MEDRVQEHGPAASSCACGTPRTRDPLRLPGSSLVAKLPSVQITRGSISSIWRSRCGAGLDLGRQRVAVVGRPAFEHVRDEALLAREADLPQQLVEQLAGPAHERLALLVLVEPGASPTNIRSALALPCRTRPSCAPRRAGTSGSPAARGRARRAASRRAAASVTATGAPTASTAAAALGTPREALAGADRTVNADISLAVGGPALRADRGRRAVALTSSSKR